MRSKVSVITRPQSFKTKYTTVCGVKQWGTVAVLAWKI